MELKFHYRVRKGPPLACLLSQMYPVHIFSPCFLSSDHRKWNDFHVRKWSEGGHWLIISESEHRELGTAAAFWRIYFHIYCRNWRHFIKCNV